jgi:chromate reductase, NAD(P)H dehydrogenase (quinone)
MPSIPRILAFAGSARRASLNRKLLAVVAGEVRAAGAEVTLLDLNELPLPLYHGDLEEEKGIPENAVKIAALVASHAGLLVASPEYNGLITPLLKNTLDWSSRIEPEPFPGRVAAVVSASPGALGGIRSGLVARQLLMKLGCTVVPAELSLSKAHEAFDETGRLKSAHSLESARRLAAALVETTRRLTA